jgi:hypothetical protein
MSTEHIADSAFCRDLYGLHRQKREHRMPYAGLLCNGWDAENDIVPHLCEQFNL